MDEWEARLLVVFQRRRNGLHLNGAYFVSRADLEKYWADDSHIAHTCSLSSLVVPFQVFEP